MKKLHALTLTILLVTALFSGCRSRTNDSKTPSTTTVPTAMPTTMATTEAPDPTIASGNGPIDETNSTGGTDSTTGSTSETNAGTR